MDHIPTWFLWLFGTLSFAFTILSTWLIIGGTPSEREEGIKILFAWWGGVLGIFVVAVVMTTVIKPTIDYLLKLF